MIKKSNSPVLLPGVIRSSPVILGKRGRGVLLRIFPPNKKNIITLILA